MSEIPNDPFSAPQVQDKRVKPSGSLPRHTQAWVLSGIALVMVGVIAFSGRNHPGQRQGSMPPPGPAGVDPNAAQIEEYRKRIEEETAKLRAEQARLTGMPLAIDPSLAAPGYSQPGSVSAPASGLAYAPEIPDSLETDLRKREYESRFASNIALTYRKDSALTQAAPSLPAAPGLEALARVLSLYGSSPSASAPAEQKTANIPPPEGSPSAPDKSAMDKSAAGKKEDELQRCAAARDAEIDRAGGKQYRLFEGTVFETVLTNRLDGSFSGPVNCMVTTNVYSQNAQHILIPQGSRVLGEVRKVETFGDQRLAVMFHRLIMPDGYSVSLDKFQGLNQIGETGLTDQINHHYLQVFGVSLAIGAIAGLSQANTSYGVDQSPLDAYRQGMATSLSQSSLHILDRYLNVLPTFTIREGHRVKIHLSDDLLLPAYDQHQMPNDL